MARKRSKQADISKHYNGIQLFRYAIPSIFMMLILGIYEIIDGFFISNFVGATAFAAVNLIMPIFFIFTAMGMMLGSGGGAIIGNLLGQRKPKQARWTFSLFVYFCILLGIILAIAGFFAARPLCILVGGEGEILEIAAYYAQVSMISAPAFMLLSMFDIYYNTAGKPQLGLINALVSIFSLVTLDSFFVIVMKMGLNGIIVGTVTTEIIAVIIPLVYFSRHNKSMLQLITPLQVLKSSKWRKGHALIRGCINGSSEMVQQLAVSVVCFLTISQINRYVGEDGLVAYGVFEYAWIIFNSFYLGFAVASSPLMSYQQGADNKKEMKNLFRNANYIILITSIIAFALAELFAQNIAMIFVSEYPELLETTTHILRIYFICFLFAGVSIYGSALFTSLGNGLISALIAFLRTLVFETSFLILLPLFIGGDGIWYAVGLAEFCAAILCVIFVVAKGRGYGILPTRVKNC